MGTACSVHPKPVPCTTKAQVSGAELGDGADQKSQSSAGHTIGGSNTCRSMTTRQILQQARSNSTSRGPSRGCRWTTVAERGSTPVPEEFPSMQFTLRDTQHGSWDGESLDSRLSAR